MGGARAGGGSAGRAAATASRRTGRSRATGDAWGAPTPPPTPPGGRRARPVVGRRRWLRAIRSSFVACAARPQRGIALTASPASGAEPRRHLVVALRLVREGLDRRRAGPDPQLPPPAPKRRAPGRRGRRAGRRPLLRRRVGHPHLRGARVGWSGWLRHRRPPRRRAPRPPRRRGPPTDALRLGDRGIDLPPVAQLLGRLPGGRRAAIGGRSSLRGERAGRRILRRHRTAPCEHRHRARLPPRADGQVPPGPGDLDPPGLAHTGGVALYGYRFVTHDHPNPDKASRGIKKRTLELDPVRAPVVRNI